MTNLKLIISTRTQEEFDRVLEWADKQHIGAPASYKWKEHGDQFCVRYHFTKGYWEFMGFDCLDFYKTHRPSYTFLSFPEFEKQYLTNENDVHRV